MRIVYLKNLVDGRQVMVYDDGTERNNLVAVIKTSEGTIPDRIIVLKGGWNWEEELAKKLEMSKEELGL